MVVVENRQGNSDAKRMNFKSWEAAGVQDQSRAEWPLPAEEDSPWVDDEIVGAGAWQ